MRTSKKRRQNYRKMPGAHENLNPTQCWNNPLLKCTYASFIPYNEDGKCMKIKFLWLSVIYVLYIIKSLRTPKKFFLKCCLYQWSLKVPNASSSKLLMLCTFKTPPPPWGTPPSNPLTIGLSFVNAFWNFKALHYTFTHIKRLKNRCFFNEIR